MFQSKSDKLKTKMVTNGCPKERRERDRERERGKIKNENQEKKTQEKRREGREK